MIRKTILPFLFIIFLLNACEIDNYDYPDGTIYGNVIDLSTNDNIQTEQPNGFNIKLIEKGGLENAPIIFSGKPDGSFKNALIFQNEYKVAAVEGAFFNPDTVVVQVGSKTEVNFNVTPFLTVTDVSVTATSVTATTGKITVSYGISRSMVSGKITYRKTFVSDVTTVSNYGYYLKNKSTNTSSIDDATLLATNFTDEISDLHRGKTYWVRVGVLATGNGYNSLSRYNYSKIYEVSIP